MVLYLFHAAVLQTGYAGNGDDRGVFQGGDFIEKKKLNL